MLLQLLNSAELVGRNYSAHHSGWAVPEDVITVRGQTCSTVRVGQASEQVKIHNLTVLGFCKFTHSFYPFEPAHTYEG